MADFNKLASSKKIEDKLKAAQDSDCPADALDKIVMDGSVPWGTEMGNTLANAIASNSNCPPEHLSTIFENPTDAGQRLLVLQNPSCPRELMNKAVEGDDVNLKQAVLKNSTLSADVVLGCVKSESIGSELIIAISERNELDDITREIIDLKVKLAELKMQHQEDSGYAWLEESLLSITDWGRDVFEAIYKDKDVYIRLAVAKNPSLPVAMLSELMEDSESSVKLSALANPSCSKTILKKASEDTENYSSSRVRKAVALNTKTPKAVLNKLLKDEYRWVREAAASHPDINTQAIKKLITTGDRYILKGLAVNPNCDKVVQDRINNMLEDEEKYPVEYSSYEIKKNYGGYSIVEDLCGSISIDDIIEAIISGEDSWSDFIYSNFYDHEDIWHEYGPTNLVDTIAYPDSSEESIDVKAEYRYPHEGEIKIGSSAIGSDTFFHTAQSYEEGSWIYIEFELENEFKQECLTAIYQDEALTEDLVSYYEYDDPGIGESCEIEGELSTSSTSGTDITLYVNTDKGVQYCDDFCDMRDEMTEEGLDPENEDDIRKYLEKYTND